MALLLAGASSASALSYGMGWSGADLAQTASEMDVVQKSGSSFFRVPIDISTTGEVNPNWAAYDPIFENAWKNGITILPILMRSNVEGTRFLTSADAGYSNWNFWVIAAVERYGYNGTFWNGKINPRPVTTWEVWNEPNLPDNNPKRTQAQCEANANWTTFFEKPSEKKGYIGCTQPDLYGSFLSYTAASIQAASQKMAAVFTGVLFGGLAYPYGQSAAGFLSQAYAVSGVPSSFGGLSIHPYGFDFAHPAGSKTITEFQNEVNAIRSTLSGLSGGASKSLWITELGWPLNSFGNPNFPAVLNEAEQARLLNESIAWIKSVAVSKNIETLIWYNARDINIANWAYTCGLLDQFGNYRQQWWAFQQQTGAAAWPPPDVITDDASSIQEKEATLNGRINPHGTQTSYRFEYGTSTAYGTSIPVPNGEAGSSNGFVSRSAKITNLQPNTHYHYRVVGTGPAGTTYGTDHAFTTGVKWMIRNANSSGAPDSSFWFGLPGQTTVVGDWNGDGIDTPGTYEPLTGTWRLRNSNTSGGADITPFSYGGSQFIPVVGDWNGDGKTTIGLYEPTAGTWSLRNSNSAGSPDITPFSYGGNQYIPVVGDWNNDGKTTIGVYEPNSGTWSLRNSNTAGSADITPFSYGGNQYTPVVGDWNNDGKTTIGLFEKTAGTWSLRNSNSAGSPDITPFSYGGSQFKPVVGDWNNDGITTIGLYESNSGSWQLRNTNSAGSPDLNFQYGGSQYDPITGDWNGDGKVTAALVTK
jgi:hypothetical protein